MPHRRQRSNSLPRQTSPGGLGWSRWTVGSPRPSLLPGPGEAHAGAGRGTEVAEDHRAHVHCGAQVVRDALTPAVQPGPVGVPGLEHRRGQVELMTRVRGKSRPVWPWTIALNSSTSAPRSSASGRWSDLTPLRFLAASRADANASPSIPRTVLPKHLDQPPVGVPREPLVARPLRQSHHRMVVQAHV